MAFSTGEEELGMFGAGERGFCFGEEGVRMRREVTCTLKFASMNENPQKVHLLTRGN